MTYQDYVQGRPVTYGPARTVCISGQEIDWPADKLKEWRNCLAKFWQIIHEVVGPVHVNPGDPVEAWLARATPEEALRLQGYREALESLNAERDATIVKCLQQDLRALVSQLVLAGRLATPTSREGDGEAGRSETEPKK